MTTQLELDTLERDWVQSNILRVIANVPIEFTSDDVHSLVSRPPKHPNWFGVLLACMKRQGLIQRIGYQVSARPQANGRPIAKWRKL